MSFIYFYTMFALKDVVVNSERTNLECGIKPYRRNPKILIDSKDRHGKILNGSPTREGQFPWQVSLELLHPSLGFLGHWCGAVLIDENWVLSAAHCIHNDLFNLPLPPFWTVVLGEFNRHVESGHEQRIPVERIIMHRRYENFQHDLVLLKLSEPADLSFNSKIRKICLPLIAIGFPQSLNVIINNNNNNNNNKNIDNINNNNNNASQMLSSSTNIIRDNYLKNIDHNKRFIKASTIINMREIRAMQLEKLTNQNNATNSKIRRNDKFLHRQQQYSNEQNSIKKIKLPENNIHHQQDLPYKDCIATGWGKSSLEEDLTDELLQTKVPIQPNSRCKEAYGDTLKIHRGHLCGGKLNGKGGTCVGDSGGPLQCRFRKNGPWILAGVTSFGSGCADQHYPDVYTRISYYLKWILETISNTNDDEYDVNVEEN